jgi:hypothetical protein
MSALDANVAYIKAAQRVTDTESAVRLLRNAGLDAIADAAEGTLPVARAFARDAEIAWRRAEREEEEVPA